MGITCFADGDKNKKQMQENFHLFFANLSTAPVAVTNNDKDVREKRE
jgi:hypothetical protein